MAIALEKISIEYKAIFESSPSLFLLLSPDLTILNASDAYLKATMTNRHEIVGKGLFEVFPADPNDPGADGASNLRKSLENVLATKDTDRMVFQKYAIRRPDGVFEERVWSPINTPILGADQEVQYILHKVEDVTEIQLLRTDIEAQIEVKNNLAQVSIKQQKDLKESEDRFMKMFDMCPVPVYMTSVENGTFSHVNYAFEETFLMERENVIGRTVVELNLVDADTRVAKVDRLLENGGRNKSVEYQLRIGNGENKNFLASVDVIELNGKKSFIVALIDITSRKNDEENLRAANHFLDTVLENIPNTIFVKDAQNLSFLRINKAGEALYGENRETLIGKNDFDFFPPDQAEYFREKDLECFRTGYLLEMEKGPVHTRHGDRWLHIKKIPVFENGRPLYLVGISEDITYRKAQLEANNELTKELESFSYSVSHDLRAPLRAVNGYAQMLAADYSNILDEEGTRLLGQISTNAERMGRLIDDLLTFSRLGRKELNKKETDMNRLVESVVSDLERLYPHKATILSGDLHPVKCDPGLVTQVLINLIGNAIKYSSKKEFPLIQISSIANAKEVTFSINDNGVGFDIKYADKLFGVFQRLHRADEFEGTGVGLAIVQRIIKKHGGSVRAAAEEGKGATFYFSLPIYD